MSLPNTPMTFTPFDPLLSAEMNDLVENVDAIAAGTGLNTGALTGDKFANNSVTFPKLISKAWEELGRTSLTPAGDTLAVLAFTPLKYIKVLIFALNSGQINMQLRMGIAGSLDTGANYAWRRSSNGAADTTTASTTGLAIDTGSASYPCFTVLEMINITNQEKIVSVRTVGQNTAGAANAPARMEFVGKYVNTSGLVDSIGVVNVGTGDYAIGSTLIVLGHN